MGQCNIFRMPSWRFHHTRMFTQSTDMEGNKMKKDWSGTYQISNRLSQIHPYSWFFIYLANYLAYVRGEHFSPWTWMVPCFYRCPRVELKVINNYGLLQLTYIVLPSFLPAITTCLIVWLLVLPVMAIFPPSRISAINSVRTILSLVEMTVKIMKMRAKLQ